jgi:hypothetical protein
VAIGQVDLMREKHQLEVNELKRLEMEAKKEQVVL